MKTSCDGGHQYFVAEVVGVEAEGRIFVLIVCTRCGDFRAHAEQVSESKSPLRLLREEKEN